jgi:hypothetical protein
LFFFLLSFNIHIILTLHSFSSQLKCPYPGKQVIRDEENVQEKTLNPAFYKLYVLCGNLPGKERKVRGEEGERRGR